MTLCFNLLAERAAKLGFGIRQTDAQHFDLYALDNSEGLLDQQLTQADHQQLLQQLQSLEQDQS
ncbi:hypothetical protein [Ferrimonas senticii]|uniref:hypothetical protein n=1 Tax=Ferrimonas senticii TaxID=394566 RepID=UPI00040B0E5B|nr:hypothetical protein [Ferrimonas senticii]